MTINTTPLDTTPNTPLDAIKAAFLRAHDRINTSFDGLIGARNIPEDSEEIALLDSVDYALACLACEQLGYDKPDRNWVPTREDAPALYRYDDGTPVYYHLPVAPGTGIDIWPRFDTKADIEAVLGYALDLAWPTKEAKEAKAAREAAALAESHTDEGMAAAFGLAVDEMRATRETLSGATGEPTA